MKPLVVITGASSGIGSAIARRFAKEHFPLVLLSRRQEKLEHLKQELKTETTFYPLDVTQSAQVHAVMAQIEQEIGPIGVLVNNAGLALGLDMAYSAKMEHWERCIQTNINGVLHCTHAVLPAMVKRNKGHILNMGSIAGTYPYPGGNVYGATKAFLHQFSLNLRADLIGKNIRVSCIEPGLVGGTEFSQVRFEGDAAKAASVYQNTQPLTPEDIAEIVYFCHALPSHVNINTVEVMPVFQASSALTVHHEPRDR